MEIKTISVTYQRKFNLGDYESVEIGCSLWGQIDPEEDAEGATQFLFEQAKTAVKEAAMPLISKSVHQMNKAKIYKKTDALNEDELDSF
ncbi:hypothetical protein [Nostoc sp. FACHB-190]|uniref:hypothetical protein n=1 Tax=Nostoc sp. FACHB-190 TaxID=2692838 RepID=UPI001684F8C7|nr:hypothetical protein [Nostoc sp. FACHB-190]MBD2303879.1 hypothetical protein [Nostoc sp. FACHB-190]